MGSFETHMLEMVLPDLVLRLHRIDKNGSDAEAIINALAPIFDAVEADWEASGRGGGDDGDDFELRFLEEARNPSVSVVETPHPCAAQELHYNVAPVQGDMFLLVFNEATRNTTYTFR